MPKMPPDENLILDMISLYQEGKLSTAEAAEKLGVSSASFLNYLKDVEAGRRPGKRSNPYIFGVITLVLGEKLTSKLDQLPGNSRVEKAKKILEEKLNEKD